LIAPSGKLENTGLASLFRKSAEIGVAEDNFTEPTKAGIWRNGETLNDMCVNGGSETVAVPNFAPV
jgi:hypothetical protein